MADMVATSTDAEDETPFPSGTAEETWKNSCTDTKSWECISLSK